MLCHKTRTSVAQPQPRHQTYHSLGDAYFRADRIEKATETWESACRLASTSVTEDWQMDLAVEGYFKGAIDGVCDVRLIDAFHSCAKAKCIF